MQVAVKEDEKKNINKFETNWRYYFGENKPSLSSFVYGENTQLSV